MPRQLRVEYPAAAYHVRNRGDRREPILRDDADRQRFIATLGEVCAKTGWPVHARCLMGNHFHLVMETPQGNLVAEEMKRRRWTEDELGRRAKGDAVKVAMALRLRAETAVTVK
jgi:REP element-mobilizing transposase RayT